MPLNKPKIGYRYYPDTDHYTRQDLDIWLPELSSLQADVLVLTGSSSFAIPEHFLVGLMQAGIQPLIHIPQSLSLLDSTTIEPILQAYANWGVSEIFVGSPPNARASWMGPDWTRADLIERFLDRMIPVLETELRLGLTPLLPPLVQGGDYWDTAFLRAVLEGLQRRAHPGILQALGIGLHAYTFGKPLSWGAGGPSSWPESIAYITPEGSEDQCGFHSMDWYSEISFHTLGRSCSMYVLAGGYTHATDKDGFSSESQSRENAAVMQTLLTDDLPHLECFAFDHLVSMPAHSDHDSAWYDLAGAARPVVEAVQSVRSKAPKSTCDESPPRSIINHIVYLPDESASERSALLQEAAPFLAIAQPVITFDLSAVGPFQRATVLSHQPASSNLQSQLKDCGADVTFFNQKTIPALNAAANASQTGR